MSSTVLSSLDVAIDAFRQGKMLIVVDDEDRENEGDLVLAADFVTPEAINFMVTHARGLVCLAMRGALLDRLQIPMMVPQAQNRSGFGTGFTLSVEAAHGVSTGISAEDRAHTIRTLISPDSTAADIAMPGHVFPLRARDGGVLERRGQTEASVDLSALAGLTPAGVICEIMRHDGSMMRLDDLGKFATEHDLHIISVEQLAQFRLSLNQGNMAGAVDAQAQQLAVNAEAQQAAANSYDQKPAITADTQQAAVKPYDQQAAAIAQEQHPPAKSNGHQHRTTDTKRLASTSNAFEQQPNAHSLIIEIGRSVLPTAHGDFDIVVFRDHQGLEHSALIKGKPEQEQAPLVRLHSECLTGDAFGSLRCDCGPQLQSALQRINKAGVGAVMYLRQEGRGIGLGNKIRAYALQDQGRDTVDANQELGFPADARTYDVAAAMLNELEISSVRLLSNNPAKQAALESFGISVEERVPLVVDTQTHNESYLRTKAERMGHNYFRDEA